MLTNPCLAHRTLCSALGFIKRNFKKKEEGEGSQEGSDSSPAVSVMADKPWRRIKHSKHNDQEGKSQIIS